MDKDNDGLVSKEEFIKSTNDPEFEKDDEWKPVVDDEEYSEDELKEYERQLEEEAERNREVRLFHTYHLDDLTGPLIAFSRI